MAVLPDADRQHIWAHAMRLWSARTSTTGALTKADLRAAVDAIDQWTDDNTAAYNAAIPQPARGALTLAQKAELLELVVRVRGGEVL